MQYFDIYVDGMKDLYTYSDINNEFSVGEYVVVPFRNIKKSAIIIKVNNATSFDFKVLNIDSRLKNSVKLSDKYIELVKWLVSYYLSSYDSVIKALIPKNIKIKYKQNYYLNFKETSLATYKDNAVLNFICSLAEITYSTVKSKFKKSVIDKLVEENYLFLDTNTIKINIENINYLKEKNEEIFQYFYKKTIIKKEKT